VAVDIEKLEREIAEINALLEEEGINVPVLDVSVERGLQLTEILNEKLRPFIVRYTALVNRNQAYVPVDTTKLQGYVPLAEELSRCVEPILFSDGVGYNHALNLIINGFEDVEEAVFWLFWAIQMTDDFKGTKSLLTYHKGNSGFLNLTPVITVEGEEE
jgi:hypothetical protein